MRLHSVGKADTGRLLSGDPRLYEPVAARVSPDGRQVAVLGYGDEEFIGSVAIVSMTGALRTRVLASSREKSYGTPYGRGTLGWLSASELLVYRTTYTGTGGPGEFVREALVVDVPTMRTRVLARDVGLESANVVPGKGFLLLTRTGENARVEFLDKDGATRTPVAAGRAAEVAPDGGTAAVWGFTASDDAANTTSLRLVPLPSGTPSRTVDLPPGDLVEVAWSPVSNRLLAVVESSGESDETTRRAFVVRVPGGAVAELALTDYASGGGWSPDGTRLLYTTGSGEVSVVQVP
ncbi:MAG: hypothetical protein QOE45_3320 [Frankiaceae bacterium]|nr:hypothetical protein [Frankiaceae bacterium]